MDSSVLAFTRRAMLAGFLAAGLWPCGRATAQPRPDPLPSWNNTGPKQAILTFVARVTRQGGPDFVKPAERIAVFDNDGTLWAEQPIYFQVAFAFDRLKAMAPQHPEWKTTQPYKAVLEADQRTLHDAGEKGVLAIVAATHTGITTEEFHKNVADWLATAKHPTLNRPYTALVYQPMLELLAFLRANGFKTFIVSGGGVEFMRVFAEKVYGIPPEQVIGSSGVITVSDGRRRQARADEGSQGRIHR